MAIKVPNEGELEFMEYVRAAMNADGPRLHLYQNNYTPVDGSQLADFTECDFDGYASVQIIGWPVPITVGGKAYVALGPTVFLCTGAVTPNDVYGFYVTDNAETLVLWAARDPAAPVVMDGPGDTYPVTPSLTLKSEA